MVNHGDTPQPTSTNPQLPSYPFLAAAIGAMSLLSKLLELDVHWTRRAQQMSVGYLEVLIYPGELKPVGASRAGLVG